MNHAESSDRRLLLGSVAGAAGIAALAAMSKAGPINPPAGTVASTGKTLTSVEPRTDLNASVGTPGVSTSPSAEFIISAPGSYYLSANISATKADAILITAADVTLDLNGFRIMRTSGSGGGAVLIGTDNVVVRNGTVSGFTDGVAINAFPSPRLTVVRDVRVRNCGGNAISTGEASLVESCTVYNCANGIVVKKGSAISGCTVEAANGTYPILTDLGCVVTRCTVAGGTSSSGYGLYAGSGSAVDSCSVYGYTGARAIHCGIGVAITNCSAIANNVTVGIEIGTYSSAIGCVASINTASGAPSNAGGILAGSNCTLERCTANQNTGSLNSTGISGDVGCTLSGCTASGNASHGIQIAGGSVTGCTASGNGRNGINASDRSSIADCVARGNTGNGVYANYVATIRGCVAALNSGCGILVDGGGGGEIVGNQCEENGNSSGAQGSGIRVQGPYVRIRENHCYVNWRNIEVTTIGVVVTGNHCGSPGSGSNFTIANGNKVGVIVACPASGAINGNTGGAGLGSTDPTANFSY